MVSCPRYKIFYFEFAPTLIEFASNFSRSTKNTRDNPYQGGKFLKKLWCCVDGEYHKIILFYQLRW